MNPNSRSVKIILAIVLGLALLALLSPRTIVCPPFYPDQLQDSQDAYNRGDFRVAYKLAKPLAIRGDAVAQFNLGHMYSKGEGVPQDKVLAWMWFDLSAANGDAEAGENREKLSGKMTPSQLEEARELARKWGEKQEK